VHRHVIDVCGFSGTYQQIITGLVSNQKKEKKREVSMQFSLTSNESVTVGQMLNGPTVHQHVIDVCGFSGTYQQIITGLVSNQKKEKKKKVSMQFSLTSNETVTVSQMSKWPDDNRLSKSRVHAKCMEMF
jgi:hypothetical protein